MAKTRLNCSKLVGEGTYRVREGFMIARRLLGRNSLQEVVGMLWGLPGSTLGDKVTSGLQSPMDGTFSVARTRLTDGCASSAPYT